jgi:drug/metabolite transporter (DMT)-like permease
MFAMGQKKAFSLDNPLVFIALSAILCVVLTVCFAPFLGSTNYVETFKNNSNWVALSGVGLFLTYLGFNLLYSNYGASNYILYAVLSIITTTVIVGLLVFKEIFNIYHWLALSTAVLTIGLFTFGNYVSKA